MNNVDAIEQAIERETWIARIFRVSVTLKGLDGSATLFLAIYLLVHGIVKVVLVVAVLRGHTGAYLWMIGFLIAFVTWQLYELVLHVTIGLMILTLFDVLIIALTVHEYRPRRRQAAARTANAT